MQARAGKQDCAQGLGAESVTVGARVGYDGPMRTILILTLLLAAGCQKAEPRSTSGRPYEAERIKTLTHDTDLLAPKTAGEVDLRSVGEALRTTPSSPTP